jgi:hypothetical protein
MINHDERIMAYSLQAIIQWLGTSCGNGFLRKTQAYAEKEEERLANIIDPGRVEWKTRFAKLKMERDMKDMFSEEIKQKIAEEVAKQLPLAVDEELKKREEAAQRTINPIRTITI